MHRWGHDDPYAELARRDRYKTHRAPAPNRRERILMVLLVGAFVVAWLAIILMGAL